VEIVAYDPSHLFGFSFSNKPVAALSHLLYDSANSSKVAHVHSMVFGTNDSYMMAWRGKDGRNYQGISVPSFSSFAQSSVLTGNREQPTLASLPA
jgi:hypothetical protein